MNTTVQKFVMPTAVVRFSNLAVDATKKRFSMTLSVKDKGKRSFKSEQVEGTITAEVSEFFKLKRHNSIKVQADNDKGYAFVRTGTMSTSFERYLQHRDITFVPGILDTLVFESDNDSPDRVLNPFKVVLMNDKAILSLVNIAAKKRTETVNHDTGELTTFYTNKYYRDANGAMRQSFVAPKFYKRLIRQVAIEVSQIPESAQ